MRRAISAVLMCCMIFNICGCKKNILKNDNPEKTPGNQAKEELTDLDVPVRFAVLNEDSFNPLISESYSFRRIMERVYEPLFALDENFKPFGVLAEYASVSSDGMSITVKLRDGVLWHDNTRLTADDVVYTVNKIAAGETKLSIRALRSASKRDNLNAVINLKEPVMNAIALLNFPVMKNGALSDKSGVPIGTGRYRYGSKISVDEHSFVPYEAYHGNKAVNGFEVAVVDTLEEQVQMFRVGETDAYFPEADETIGAANGNTKSTDENTDVMVYVGVNFNNPIFWGEKTRQAVERLINKNAIVNNIAFKRGIVAEYPINPKHWLASRLDNSSVYNIDEAERLMIADGWAMSDEGYYTRTVNGEEQDCIIRILTSEDEVFLKISEYISKELTIAGINCSVHSIPFEEYAAMIDAGYYDLFVGEKSIGSNMDFSGLIKRPNAFTYVSEPLELAVREAACVNDENTLKSLYETCALTIKNDTPFIPLYFKTSTVFYSEMFE